MISEQNEILLRRWLWAIVIAGVLLRFWGIGFGLPFVYHPDEHNLTYHVFEAGANRLNPGWFEYPSLMMYLLGGLYLVYAGVLLALGQIQSLSELWALYQNDPTVFTLLGRSLVALLGVLTIPLVFRLGRWAYGRTTGLFAALFLMAAFLHVRDSRFITVDVPLTLFCTLALWGALLGRCKDAGYLRLASLAVGLAAGTKYTGALVIIPVWAAILLTPGLTMKKKVIRGVQCLSIAALVFLLTTPYAVLDSERFLRDLRYQQYTTEASSPIYGGRGVRWLSSLTGELRWGLGLPLEVLALTGVVYAFRKRYRADIILLAFIVPYFLFIGGWSRHWGRWILPIVPPLLVLGARYWVEELIPRFRQHPFSKHLVAFAVCLLLLVPLYASLRCVHLLSRTDTRTLAYNYLRESFDLSSTPIFQTAFSLPLEAQSALSVDEYMRGIRPKTPSTVIRVYENTLLKDRPAFASGIRHEPQIASFESLVSATREDEEPLRLFVISSFYRELASDPRVIQAYPALESYHRFYEELEQQTTLLAEFSPARPGKKLPFHVENIYSPTVYLNRMERPGPRIEIRLLNEESLPPSR